MCRFSKVSAVRLTAAKQCPNESWNSSVWEANFAVLHLIKKGKDHLPTRCQVSLTSLIGYILTDDGQLYAPNRQKGNIAGN
jgi:hypothetical protein